MATLFLLGACYAWWMWPPNRNELQQIGEHIVEAIEAQLVETGRYPVSLDELEGVDLTLWYGGWQYNFEHEGYTLQIGYYNEDMFELHYYSASSEWYMDS